ncbi:MAG: hypothetical protein U0790_28070 [Isosphaeraceae bacterium]
MADSAVHLTDPSTQTSVGFSSWMVVRLHALLKSIAVVLASGYILFFVSERVFWSFWRPGDNPAEYLITWVAYSLIGWIFLDPVRRFRVARFPAVFLCGAVYGWVAEGIVVDTMYGDPSNPFPLSLSWTGLAWHALLTVGVGWHGLGKALTQEKPGRTAWLSLAIGLVWGLWAVWWPAELKEADTSVRGFASHTFVTSVPFVLSWLVLSMARPDWFRVGRVATVLLWALAAFLFVAARVPTRPIAALVLPALLLACWIALRRNAHMEQAPVALDVLLGSIRPWNVLVLLLIPASGIATYALFHAFGRALPTNIVLYVITMPLGFWFFGRSLWVASQTKAG